MDASCRPSCSNAEMPYIWMLLAFTLVAMLVTCVAAVG